MDNQYLLNENVDPVLFYSFATLMVIFSVVILHASKNGVRISRYLKMFK